MNFIKPFRASAVRVTARMVQGPLKSRRHAAQRARWGWVRGGGPDKGVQAVTAAHSRAKGGRVK